MALLDLIASGNTDIPTFIDSYQTGLKNMRESRAAEQTATLRDLQIDQAQKEAGNYEEDRARRLAAEDLQTSIGEQSLDKGEVDIKASKQQIAASKEQVETSKQAREALRKKQEQDLYTFTQEKDAAKRQKRLDNRKEVEEHIAKATSGDEDAFMEYLQRNADAIIEVGDEGTKQIVENLLSGKVPREDISKVMKSLKNALPDIREQNHKIELAQVKLKEEEAAKKPTLNTTTPWTGKESEEYGLGLMKESGQMEDMDATQKNAFIRDLKAEADRKWRSSPLGSITYDQAYKQAFDELSPAVIPSVDTPWYDPRSFDKPSQYPGRPSTSGGWSIQKRQ